MSRGARVLERGREEVRAATALLAAGFPSQALSRAYVGAMCGAEAALQAVDAVPETPAGVVSAFNRRVVVQGGLDSAHGQALRRLFDDRHDVDHALAHAPVEEARTAVSDAAALIAAAESWIAGRPSR